jgi:hypothetical protein
MNIGLQILRTRRPATSRPPSDTPRRG